MAALPSGDGAAPRMVTRPAGQGLPRQTSLGVKTPLVGSAGFGYLQSPVILRQSLVSPVEIQKATLGFGASLRKLPLKPFWGAVQGSCKPNGQVGTRQRPQQVQRPGLERGSMTLSGSPLWFVEAGEQGLGLGEW